MENFDGGTSRAHSRVQIPITHGGGFGEEPGIGGVMIA